MPRVTKETRLLALLADGRWHDATELSVKVSHRFGGYLFTLKRKYPGRFDYEKRLNPDAPRGQAWWQYRAVNTSVYLLDWAQNEMRWI